MRRSHVRQNVVTDHALGLVMHPKTREIVIAFVQNPDINVVNISNVGRLYTIGSGWYMPHRTDFFGYPRVHLGSNRFQKGAGWGSVLYNSLCVGARVHDLGASLPHMDISASGVCSDPEDRTPEASRWWEGARKRGFSYVRTVRVEGERTGDFQIDPRLGARRDADGREFRKLHNAIREYLEDAHDISDFKINMPIIEGTGTYFDSYPIELDILPFYPENGATGISNMVLCTFKNAPEMSLKDLSWLTEDEVSDFNVDVLRLINLREADEKFVALVRRVAEVMGALDVLEENLSAPRQNRRYNSLTPAQQAAARRVRLADWADLDD